MELDGTIDESAFVNGNVTYDAATGKIEGELSDIEAGKTVTLTIPVKLKENTTETVFRNVAQVIKGEHTVEGEVTVHKNSRDFAVIKTADRTLADSEDLVKYTLTVRNNGSYSSVLTEEEPLLFWDVPEGVTIEEEKQSDEFIQSKPNGVIITREFEKDDQGKVTRVVFKASGKFNAGETASVNVWATMPKVTSGAVSVKNTAGTGENPPTSETETVVEPKQGDSEETKVVYGADGKPLPDPGVVSEGDILTYKITITNTGESNITEVYGQDTLVNKDGSGSTTHYAIDENGNNSGTLILTVEKADGVTGIKVGDCVTINNKWGIKDFSFLITSNDATKKCADTILKNSDFSIAPRGTLTLSYRLKLLDNFKDAYNQVSINGHEPVTSVEYAVVDGKFDVYKYAGGTYASDGSKKYDLDNGNKSYSLNPDDYSSAEDLQNKLVIPYAVVVKNLSTNNGEETFDNFTVTDTLPDGLEWVKYDQNNDVIVAAGNSGSTNSSWETDTNSWDNVKVSVSGNTITTTFTKAKQAWNNQQAYLLIFYKVRLTIDKATEIYNKLKDSKDSLVLETFKNTATLKATKPFINSEGKIGTETSDSDDFTVEENTTHVSFEKAAEGCYAGGSDHDYNGELTTVGGTAGSKIVWKLVINNDSKGNGGAPLINYSILDTLPSGYQYQKSEDGEYPNTMIVYKKDGSKNREIPFVEPTIDNTAGTIAWDFNTEVKPEFKLEPGEYLEIKYATCVKSADDSRDGIFTNYAKLTVHGYTEPGTTPGKDDFEKEYEDSASYTLSSVATSSVKTIAYNRHEEHKKDPKNDTGRGDHPMPGNYVQGMQGEDVTYTLNVKNEASATTIANMVVIDRLPYINDIGVVAGYGRGSAFEVYYDGGLAVSVDGTAVEGVTTLFSSDDHTIIGDGAGEWSTKDANNTVEWHEGYQAGDRLIRFQFPEDFKLPAGKTVTIQFNGKVPDYVENTGEGNIAWNSFAYSYTDQGETSGILIAEPAKVGVWVKTPESGKITVNKTFKSAGTNRTFYFAVFTKNEQDEYVRFSSVKSLSLTGAADGTNGTVVFDHLPYDSEKETVYHVFETDAQGNILTSDQEGKVTIDGVNFTVTGQGQDVTLADGVKERTVSLVNEEEQLISIEGEKVWDDAGNEGARPETITVRLKANGEEVAHQEVTKGNGWKWKFENFPEYEAGQKITYTVTEDAVENYVASEITGTYNIKNTYNPGKTSITVQKIWSDGDNQDGKRPTGIEVELYQNGTATGKKVTLNEENHWKHIWTDLDEKANGQKITYSVKETGESGGKVSFSGAEYTVTYSDEVAGTLTVTNSHTPSMISIEGEKVWDDAGNEGARPETITVRLKANGEEVAHQEVTKGNGWKWKFENFPEYKAGQKITYTVTEDAVENYVASEITGTYNIKNTYNPGKTSITVQKIWSDGDNQDGKRPTGIEVELYQNGTATGKKVTLNEENHWKHIWTDLDEKANGQKITYSVKETGESGGKVSFSGAEYTVTYSDEVAGTLTVTNSHTPSMISIEGEKVWDDAGNEGARPETITVRLKANGEEVAHQEVTKDNNWKWKFENFPEYEAGQKITYTVTEDPVDGYITTAVEGKYDIVNTPTTGIVDKLDDNKETVVGATLQIRKEGEEEIVETWITDGNSHDITGKLVAGTTYVLEETNVPAGYVAADSITFTVEADGTITVDGEPVEGNLLTLIDKRIHFNVNKVELGSGNEVEGAELTVLDKEGNVIDSWISRKGETHDFGDKLKTDTEYTLRETVAPDGYKYATDIEFKVEKDGTITTNAKYVEDENGNKTYLMEDDTTKVTVTKLDDNKETVVGATLQIRKEGEEEAVETWTTDGNSHDITGKLVAGTTYVLEENNVPAGYVAADSITFTVEADGSITVGGEKVDGNKLTLIDKRIHFNVNKVELGSGNEVEGAELTVLDKEGNVIDSWISRKGETHDFGDKLKTDTEYILRETVAPDGYKYATDIEFKVEKDGTITTTAKCTEDENGNKTYLVEDDTTKVKITKTDDVTGKALAGATLQIVDASGQVVEEWITDGTPHMVTGKLTLGATYSLVEKEAPAGYEIAESITFKVDSDDEKNAIEMKDAMTKSPTAVIAVTKDLKLNNDLVNAVDKTFYVALFADQECTKLASDVKAIEFKNASSSTVEFTGLDLGRTYYVKEVDKDGKGIEVGTTEDGKTFIPYYPEGQEATVKEDGGRTLLLFENQFTEWPDGFYKEIRLNITKRLIGADGKEKASDEVFYAGIFDDKELTALTSRTTQNIVELNLAGDSTTSVRVDGMVQPGESFNLYVAEVDKNGKPVADAEEFGYRVTVSGDGAVSFDENNPEASVTITNQELPEATPTVTPEETPTVTPTPTTSTGVKTGDDTPIGFYMVLLFAAAIVMEEAARRRRRNTQK